MQCVQIPDPFDALGRAADVLRRVQPFADYPFGRLSNVLMGQVKRGHCVFTLIDDRVVGYAGWAMCREDIARAWIENRYVPNFAECSDGDCWVGITFYAETREACFFQSRWLRRKYPNAKVLGIRDYGRERRPTQLTNPVPAEA